jgi:ectoine hydroxylase
MPKMVALDPCVEENGCLQVLRGSHHMGRIDHFRDAGGQVNADAQRIAWAESRHEKVTC